MKKQPITLAMEDLAEWDDRQLIESCLTGESAAWETLISRYRRLIYSIPLKSRLSPDDAADIFQSVSLKLYEKLGTLRDHAKISSWLITTATRECWRLAARSRREAPQAGGPANLDDTDPLVGIPSLAPLADQEREILERQHVVRESVERLPERCRELLTMLFYQEDESYAEIARRMEMPVPSIGPTRARCLEKLKKLLEGRF